MKIHEYVNNGLVHSIHTSERRSFRSCRRRWDWAYRQMYYPLVTPGQLEFGVWFHAAMEVFYDPKMWGKDLEVQKFLALEAFRRAYLEDLKKFTRLNGEPNEEVRREYKERLELGLNMFKFYAEKISPEYDNNLTPVGVEEAFEVLVSGPQGEYIWCKCDRCFTKWMRYHDPKGDPKNWDRGHVSWIGLPVTYGGRLDCLMQDEHGRYWIVDWKQQPLDANIITPNGWVKMGDLKVGDYVTGSNGKPTKVLGVYPKGEHEVYEIVFRDGTIVECSKDHAWAVKSTQFGKKSVLEAQDIMNKPTYESYAVELPSGPVLFDNKRTLPMHPYVLGALIGDGCFTRSVLTFASQSGETVELLKQYATDDVTITDQRHHGANKWQITGPWKSQLQELNLWTHAAGSKFIPSMYLEASVEDRILLLQGLCDTDGNTGMYRWTTTSPILAECFRELVWSLGGSAMMSVSKERLHQNGTTINVPQYGVNYWLPEDIEPNQLERKRVERPRRTKAKHRGIKEVRATGIMKEMQCIRVDADDHLYMTENFILTHNTTARILNEGKEAAFLELDDQIASYCWALWTMGIDVAGFIYVEIKKGVPQPPELLTRKYKGKLYSTSKQQLTTYNLAYRTFVDGDDEGFQTGLYDEYLQWLKVEGPTFHQRHQIHKNEHELKAIGNYIYEEAQDIVGSPRVYPQPGRFSCPSCLYRQPCLGVNQGEDYVYTLDTMFERRLKHYYEEKATTD